MAGLRGWPACLGELGSCLKHNLGSGGCFLGVGGGKVGNQRNMEIPRKTDKIGNFCSNFGLGGEGCVAAGVKVGYMGLSRV